MTCWTGGVTICSSLLLFGKQRGVAGLPVSSSFFFCSSEEVGPAGSPRSGSGLNWYGGSVRRRLFPHLNGTCGADSRTIRETSSRIEATSRSLSVKRSSGGCCVAMSGGEREDVLLVLCCVESCKGRKERGRDGQIRRGNTKRQ